MAKPYYEKLSDVLDELPENDSLIIFYKNNNSKFDIKISGATDGNQNLAEDIAKFIKNERSDNFSKIFHNAVQEYVLQSEKARS